MRSEVRDMLSIWISGSSKTTRQHSDAYDERKEKERLWLRQT